MIVAAGSTSSIPQAGRYELADAGNQRKLVEHGSQNSAARACQLARTLAKPPQW
jgi:hypothetical protein